MRQALGPVFAVFLFVAGLQGQEPSHSQRMDGQVTPDASIAKPIFVPPGGSRSIESAGNVRIKVSGADNGGAVAVLEVQTTPDFGTPVHLHHVENEWFYAIEGEYDVKVGNEVFHLKPGGSVYAPKLVPHAISDVSEKGGKLMVVAQPAGQIEAFSIDLYKVASSGTSNEAAFAAVFLKHNMDILGPPLPKKHPPSSTP